MISASNWCDANDDIGTVDDDDAEAAVVADVVDIVASVGCISICCCWMDCCCSVYEEKGKDHTFCVYTEQFILMMLIWMEMIVMVMGWIMVVYRLANGLLSMHTNTPSSWCVHSVYIYTVQYCSVCIFMTNITWSMWLYNCYIICIDAVYVVMICCDEEN